MDTPIYAGNDDEAPARFDADAMPTGGGEALNLTVCSSSRGEHSDAYPTGGGEMLIDLEARAPTR